MPIILMVTTLHKGDEKISSELPLLGVGNNMQTLEVRSPTRRYGLQAIICSSSSDKDDDGNATLSPEEQRSQQRAPKRQPAKQQQPVAEEACCERAKRSAERILYGQIAYALTRFRRRCNIRHQVLRRNGATASTPT